MRVLVVGAGGVIGTRLVPQLIQRGHAVAGTSRTPGKAGRLRELGAEPLLLDALDAQAVRAAVATARPDAIIYQATALAGLSDLKHFDASFAATSRLRTEGIDILLEAARAAGVGRVVAQSYACHRYARAGGPVKTEDDPLDPKHPRLTPPAPSAAVCHLQSVRSDKETIMQAPSEQMTAPSLQALLTGGALAGEWILDRRRSSIGLKSRSIWGLARVNGIFREVSGHGTISADGGVSGTVTVAAASIDTSNTRRDTHLRSADFFDSANHPDITFTADGIRPAGQGVTVTGTLTVRGLSRPVSFDAAASARGDGEICLDAETRINRADFGLTWNQMGMASMNNTLTIHTVFTRH